MCTCCFVLRAWLGDYLCYYFNFMHDMENDVIFCKWVLNQDDNIIIIVVSRRVFPLLFGHEILSLFKRQDNCGHTHICFVPWIYLIICPVDQFAKENSIQ